MGAPERYVEDYLRRRCKEEGILCYKWTSPGHAGVPDDIIIGHGKTIYVECKSRTGRTSDQQEHRIREMRNAGADVRVCNSREIIDDVIKDIKRGRRQKTEIKGVPPRL